MLGPRVGYLQGHIKLPTQDFSSRTLLYVDFPHGYPAGPSAMSSRVLNEHETLPQILTLQHAQETLNRIVHALSNMIDRLEAPVLDPLGDVLVTRLAVPHDVRIED